MTSPYRNAPGSGGFYRHGNSDCRLCHGDGWVRKTLSERNVDEEFEMLMNLVFGPEDIEEGFASYGRERFLAPLKHKRCSRCHEDEAESDLREIYFRRKELKALRILAERTERGEKFSRGEPSTVLLNHPLPKKKATQSKKSNQSLSEQLTQLAALRESGALTAQEFKLAKERLLGTRKTTAKGKSKKKKRGEV